MPDGGTPSILLVQAGSSSRLYPFRSHPLGLMYLASSLRREFPDISVKIRDMKVEPLSPGDIANEASAGKFDLVGIGGFSVHSDIMLETAQAVRSRCPEATIISGGPHASANPASLLSTGNIDAAVCGEGESAIVQIARAVKEGACLSGISGVITESGTDGTPRAPSAPPHPDSLPFPAWDLVPLPAYRAASSFSILGQRNYMSLFTSRGCPFNCIYCHGIFGKKFRPRSAESVAGEVAELVNRHGIRDFDVLDDTFNMDRARVHEICNALLALGTPVQIAFPNGLRSDILDGETLALMRRAGTTYISFAIESATPRLQKLMRKNLNIEKAREAIKHAAKLGIFCNGFFMLGFPTETEDELAATVSFAVKSPLHTAHFLKVTVFDGTELSEMAHGGNGGESGTLKYYDRSSNLSEVENARFNSILAAAHRRFYINPLRLLRLAAAHPRKINLLRFAAFAVRRIVFASEKG